MAKMIVNIVERVGQSLVVQWNDDEGIHRSIIPEELVNGNVVDKKSLSMAIPYGVDWANVFDEIMNEVTPEVVATELRKRGIWTVEDLLSNSQAALGAIQEAYGVDFAKLLRAARKLTKE